MFIAFEGIDGSGKTTLSNRLAARLRERGVEVCHAREGGALASRVAETIRALARDIHHLALRETAELLLYAAREAQTTDEVVRPALEAGQLVITDRYVFSHYAHARQGRGIDRPNLWEVLSFAVGGLMPDLVVLVDVEPAIAQARKRCAKLSSERTGAPSRKGQAGAGLPARIRQGLLELAAKDPARWIVLRNTWASLDEAEEALFAAVWARLQASQPVAGPTILAPARPPEWEPQPGLSDAEEIKRALLRAVDAVARREPPLAAHLLAGLSGAEVDERRLKLARFAPNVVAAGLRGLSAEGAMVLRHALKVIAPRQVARSLTQLDDEQANALRLELALAAPAEVARSLKGLDGAPAMALRQQLRAVAPAEVLASLARLDHELAWQLRDQLSGCAPEAMATSVGGLDSERAWRVREALVDEAPLEVVHSLSGVSGPRAHALRQRFLKRAPRAVLETLEGLDDAEAWRMRESVGERMLEALSSAIGLGSERAWALREKLAAAWPGACAASLAGLAEDARARRLIADLLARFPTDLDLLSSAAWALDPARARPAAAPRPARASESLDYPTAASAAGG